MRTLSKICQRCGDVVSNEDGTGMCPRCGLIVGNELFDGVEQEEEAEE